jgi:hypothetical protein
MQTTITVKKLPTNKGQYHVHIEIIDMNLGVSTTTTKSQLIKSKLPYKMKKDEVKVVQVPSLLDFLSNIGKSTLSNVLSSLLLHGVLEYLSMKWGKL